MKSCTESRLNNALLSFAILFITISCQSKRDPLSFSPPVFKEQKTVNIVEIEIDKMLYFISNIEIIEDKIVATASDGTNAVSIFDKNNGKLINSVLTIGRGPGEYTSGHLFLNTSGDSVYIFDMINKAVSSYTSEEFIKGCLPNRVVILDKSNLYLNAKPLRDGKHLTFPIKGARFSIHEADGKIISSYNKYPSYKEITDTLSIHYMYRGMERTDVKPDGSKFVSTNSLGSILDIFSIKNDIITLEKEQRFYSPKFTIDDTKRIVVQPDCLIGLQELKTTDQYIYAIFSGKQKKEIRGSNSSGKYVYVFDWKGKPVKSYNLNKEISKLAIDEISQRAYVVTKDHDSTEVFGYFEL
jgi:DNA-binding beta-propeller fold protein YncE